MQRLWGVAIALSAWGWAAVAFAACPTGNPQTMEAYIYGCPTATAPYASSLFVPAVPNSTVAPTSSMLYIPANLLATLADTQTLTNKTFTSPVINGGTLSGTIAGNFTFSGVPIFSGLSGGTCANGIALDSGNHLVTTSCGGGGVSVTASTPNIVVNPSPGTGTFTVGTTAPINTQAGASYTILSTDNTKEVLRTSGSAMTDTVPQATGSFAAGFGFDVITSAAGDTLTPTTSTVNGLASIKMGARQTTSWLSDGTNWRTALAVPQPATQTGTTFLRDDMTWQAAGGAVSITAADNSIVVSPSPITGTGTVQAVGGPATALTDASTIASADGGRPFNTYTLTLTATGGATYTLANPTSVVAGHYYTYYFTEDGTGGRNITTYGSDFVFLGGTPVFNTTAGSLNAVSCTAITTSVLNCTGGAGTTAIYANTAGTDAAFGTLGEVVRAVTPNATATGTIGITAASPAVVTWTAHGYRCRVNADQIAAGEECAMPITFGGTLPSAGTIVASTVYWLIGSTITTNTFEIATSEANALARTPINITSGTGTTTANATSGSPLTSGSNPADATVVKLGAGDWEVSGTTGFGAGTGAIPTVLAGWINSTFAQQPVIGTEGGFSEAFTGGTAAVQAIATGSARESLASAIPIYMSGQATFTGGTEVVFGAMKARRAR